MLFNSHEFLFYFLPLTLFVCFLFTAGGRRRLAIVWLVLASLVFYGWWNPWFIMMLVFSVLANYALGLALTSARRSGAERHAFWLLTFGIAVNLGLLGYFKYANFFVDTVEDLFDWHLGLHEITLPLAISFFTFQQIAYLVDTRRGLTEEHSFVNYALFVCFFPQLIAGPIVHHKEMLPQFARSDTLRPRLNDLAVGLTIMAIGLFKKVVMSDRMAMIAIPIFDAAEAGQELNFLQAWGGAFAYGLQLYFDFSGYSDMAIGLARLFGIRLPINFNAPYRAVNIIDFWRRWHITLSRFLRDYLYIPLGGSRYGRARRYFSLMVTMLLGGLWHGAGWNFVIWGGLHGLYLVINHAWLAVVRLPDRWWSRAAGRLLTLIVVTLAWVFFRAETLEGAQNVFSGMMNLPPSWAGRLGVMESWLTAVGFRFAGPAPSPEELWWPLWLVFWVAFLWLMPTTQQLLVRAQPALDFRPGDEAPPAVQRWFTAAYWAPTPVWAAFAAIVMFGSLLGLSTITEFFYFRF